MEPNYIELGATAVVAVMAFKFGESIIKAFLKKEEKEKKIETHPQCAQIITLSALFKAHEDGQKEAFAVVHNGLNSNAKSIENLRMALEENTKAIAVLTAVINERIPKK